MAADENIKQAAEDALKEMGLLPEDLDAVGCIVFLREQLAHKISEVEDALKEMGLLPEDLEDAVECIVVLREQLAHKISEMEKKKLPRSLVIASDPDAVSVVDELTDRIVNHQGILEKAMQGEDIHDSLAEIKAKIESLIVGGSVQARTIAHLKTTTQKMQQMKRPEK